MTVDAGQVESLAEIRRFAIVEMWRDGYRMRDIAEALGSTENAVQVEIHGLRRKGYDIPLRRGVAHG